ncbi:uncharacterized protein JCM10292_002573 [Rhodotorula paludigena]|uniref:uncharacterized protein n=1 Tax=Rhodotorula paludigena TaxID=86838 RepID=UPI00317709D6
MDSPTTLLNLPGELRVQILAHLDCPSLASCIRSHSSFLALYNAYPEHICRAIAIRQRLVTPKTSGAAAAIEKRAPLAVHSLDDDLDYEELRDVVRSQGWIEHGREVQTWKDFARFAHSISRNWRAGRAVQRSIVLDWSGAPADGERDSFWRFKIDPSPGYLVCTGVTGGYFAFTLDGKLAWSTPFPPSSYAHVECSEGYLPMQFAPATYAIWRRTDIAPSDSAATSIPASVVELFTRETRLYNSATTGYELDAVFHVPHGCTASKLRYPLFLAASSGAEHVYLWDVRERRLRTITPPDLRNEGPGLEPVVHYVELDDHSIFVAGPGSVVMWPHGAALEDDDHDAEEEAHTYRFWPPDAPEPLNSAFNAYPHATRAWYRSRDLYTGAWTAVHHDGRGEHLVAISESNDEAGFARLMWTWGYKDAIWGEGEDKLEERTVVLVVQGDLDLVQLAVENDRAVFVAHSDSYGSSLHLLNLESFPSLSAFSASPPSPICLSPLLATLSAPSRVEMTSTAVLVPSLAAIQPPRAPLAPSRTWRAFSAAQEKALPLRWRWETLEGVPLSQWAGEERAGYRADAARAAWQKFMRTAVSEMTIVVRGADAFAVWDFAGEAAEPDEAEYATEEEEVREGDV